MLDTFKCLEKVGSIAYKLELPQELGRIHNTLHVSNLKKCYSDEPLAVPLEGLHIDDKLQFMEEPVEIIEREIKRLKQSRIPLVKVPWNSRIGPEFTWEREDSFKKKYPHLFTNWASSSTTTSMRHEVLRIHWDSLLGIGIRAKVADTIPRRNSEEVLKLVQLMEETKPFNTDECAATPPSPPACHTTARISIRPEAPMPFPSEEEVERLLALPPPPSPLISLSPPSAEVNLARAAMGRLKASSPSTHHLLHPLPPLLPPPSSLSLPLPASLHLPLHVPTSLPLPSSPLPPLPALLFIPPPVDRREDTPVAESAMGLEILRQTQIFQSVETLIDDRQYQYETARLLDQEALVSREAWAHSMGLSLAIHYELQGYRTHGLDAGITITDCVVYIDSILTAQCFQHVQGHFGDGSRREFEHFRLEIRLVRNALSVTASTASRNFVFRFLVSDNHNNMPPRRSSATTRVVAAAAAAAPITAAAVEQLIEARVYAALANHETLRNNTNGHGDGSHNSGIRNRGTTRTPRECTYKDFLNCHPLNFKGTKGVVVLAQWFEKIELVFHISNCVVENQVKFAICTFVGNALTWWNSHMKAITQDVAYAIDWKTLKKMMTVKYCPRGEIKKLEIELWNYHHKGPCASVYINANVAI
ncbi:hypothetical protein Tco_0374008 [Tanacetum coccineum]